MEDTKDKNTKFYIVVYAQFNDFTDKSLRSDEDELTVYENTMLVTARSLGEAYDKAIRYVSGLEGTDCTPKASSREIVSRTAGIYDIFGPIDEELGDFTELFYGEYMWDRAKVDHYARRLEEFAAFDIGEEK